MMTVGTTSLACTLYLCDPKVDGKYLLPVADPSATSSTISLLTMNTSEATQSEPRSTRVFPPPHVSTGDSAKDRLAFIHLLYKLKVYIASCRGRIDLTSFWAYPHRLRKGLDGLTIRYGLYVSSRRDNAYLHSLSRFLTLRGIDASSTNSHSASQRPLSPLKVSPITCTEWASWQCWRMTQHST